MWKEKDVRIGLLPHSVQTVFFFFFSLSDQEPPYSMITLHEMAETGKGQRQTLSYSLGRDFLDSTLWR